MSRLFCYNSCWEIREFKAIHKDYIKKKVKERPLYLSIRTEGIIVGLQLIELINGAHIMVIEINELRYFKNLG